MPEPEIPWNPSAARSLPVEMIAGDARTWTVQTHLAAGSTVFYVLNGVVERRPVRFFIPAANPTPGVVTDANGLATFTLASTDTANWQPGQYTWEAFAVTAGNRTRLAEGETRVLPDPAGKTPIDPRSYAERMLDAIRAVLAENITDDVAMYKIGGRELTKVDRKTLMWQEALYEARVRREHNKRNGRSVYRSAPITFGGR